MAAMALLMAGGRGERMRTSGVDTPKPLVPVRGVPLVERNLRQLLARGLPDVAVAVPAQPAEIGEFARGRLEPLTAAAGGRLAVLVEDVPLGNIGVAGRLAGRTDAVVVVYADNLTTLDPRAVLAHHRRTGAALTLAAHQESVRLPFGRLEVRAGRVSGYLEKPVVTMTICSAVSVLGPAALAALAGERPAGLVDLTVELLRRGEPVAAFEHAEPWVDVNDVVGLRRAERLVDDHPGRLGDRSADRSGALDPTAGHL